MFISYAKDREDVLLYRCLKQVANGYFVNIGGDDPTENSVSYSFYKIGWRGINIVEKKEQFEAFEDKRIRDLNLKLSEDLNLSEISRSNLMEEIHILDINISNSNTDLNRLDLAVIRPWTILVRGLTNTDQDPLKAHLVSNDYSLVYSSGSRNEIYLAAEHNYLQPMFSRPVSGDEYHSANEHHLEREVHFLNKALQQSNEYLDQALVENNRVRSEIARLYQTRSWKITYPLREGIHRIHGFRASLRQVAKKNRTLWMMWHVLESIFTRNPIPPQKWPKAELGPGASRILSLLRFKKTKIR